MRTNIPKPKAVDLELVNIRKQAHLHNKSKGITGVLYYFPHNNLFYQRLEGSEADVKDLLARITKDRRHYNVKLERSMPGERLFTCWSMHFEPKVNFYEAFSAGFNPDVLYRKTLYALKKELKMKMRKNATMRSRMLKLMSRINVKMDTSSPTSSCAGSPGSAKLSLIQEVQEVSIDPLGRTSSCGISSKPSSRAGSSTLDLCPRSSERKASPAEFTQYDGEHKMRPCEIKEEACQMEKVASK